MAPPVGGRFAPKPRVPSKPRSPRKGARGSPQKRRWRRFSQPEVPCARERPWSAPAEEPALTCRFNHYEIEAVKQAARLVFPSSDTSPSPVRSPVRRIPTELTSTPPSLNNCGTGPVKLPDAAASFSLAIAEAISRPATADGAAGRWKRLRTARRINTAMNRRVPIELTEVRRRILAHGIASLHTALKTSLRRAGVKDALGAEETVCLLRGFGVRPAEGRFVFEQLVAESAGCRLCVDDLVLRLARTAGEAGLVSEFRALLRSELGLDYRCLACAFELMDRDASGVVHPREFRSFVYELGASSAFANALYDIVVAKSRGMGVTMVALREVLRSSAPQVDLTELAQRLHAHFGSLEMAAAQSRHPDDGTVSFKAFDNLVCVLDISQENAQLLFQSLCHIAGIENDDPLPSAVLAESGLESFRPLSPLDELRIGLKRHHGCLHTGLRQLLGAAKQLGLGVEQNSSVDLAVWRKCFAACRVPLADAALQALPYVLGSTGGFSWDALEASLRHGVSPTRSPKRGRDQRRRQARATIRGETAAIFAKLAQVKGDIQAPAPDPDQPTSLPADAPGQEQQDRSVVPPRPRSALLRNRLRRRVQMQEFREGPSATG